MGSDDFSAEGLAHLDELVQRCVTDGEVPGVVSVVACGSSVHVTTAGVQTIGGDPMRANTLFRIASLTKPMTAAVVVSLVEDGLLRLGDDVDELLPELADRMVLRRPDGPLDDVEPAERPITVRDLLAFTWGFGMQGALLSSRRPWPITAAALDLHAFGPPAPHETPGPDEFMARLGALPLITQPGTTWLYSTGSQVLGVLIARATGRRFEDVLQERLLEPLGMTDTSFWTSQTDRLATAYGRVDGRWNVVDEPEGDWSRRPRFADGAAGLLSSAGDVCAFGRMLLRGGAGVLRPEMVREMVQDRLSDEQRSNPLGGVDLLDGRGWGYGLSVSPERYGWDGGSGTTWANVASHDLTVVTLTQRQIDETGPPAVLEAVLEAACDAVMT